MRSAHEGRIGIVIVAYNAATTLGAVLDRIPQGVRSRVHSVLVCDDYSQDSTYHVGLQYQRSFPALPLVVLRNEANLGYGGNQKVGYRWAIEHGLDVVVLLHGDGQYAPESIDDLLAPIVNGECDAVFGSRMMVPGSARQGGMPLYKYVGNRILTTLQNRLVGLSLSEWHSGYRAYSVDALRAIPFESNADGFDFDTEIILQLHEANKRIVEVPIPTFYGDELCYVNGVKYARDVTIDVLRYRAHKMGFGNGKLAFATPAYEFKASDDSSHAKILHLMSGLRSEPGARCWLFRRSSQLPLAKARSPRHRHRQSNSLRGAGLGGSLRGGRSRCRDPKLRWSGLRRHHRRRCARARAASVGSACRHAVVSQARRHCVGEHPELFALVPTGADGDRAIRLRPSGHPRC